MELNHVAVGIDIKALSETGEFEGYGSVAGNIDLGGDVVEPNAFSRSLRRWEERGKMPKMLWQHDPSRVVGVWKQMKEDDRGLYVKGQILTDLQLGKEAYTLMKAGALDGLSIGFRTVDFERDGQLRRLKELELWEVSLVTFPMNEQATITAVKQLRSKGEVARILRKAGVPGGFANLVAEKGFEGAKAHVDRGGGNDGAQIEAALDGLRQSLKKRVQS